jgi:hypothetical protein
MYLIDARLFFFRCTRFWGSTVYSVPWRGKQQHGGIKLFLDSSLRLASFHRLMVELDRILFHQTADHAQKSLPVKALWTEAKLQQKLARGEMGGHVEYK